jgi:hypothetical protein
MRWLVLYARSRGVPVALAVAVGAVAVAWGGWSYLSDAQTADARAITLTVMLGVSAFARTLSGPDDALDHTAAVRWPVRRFLHVIAVGAVIVGLLLPTLFTGARFEPVGLVVRNTAGLLGLTALGAALFGVAVCWIAPMTWSLIAVLPLFDPSSRMLPQIAAWLIQPPDTRVSMVCAVSLAVAGLIAYSWRGGPRIPRAETGPVS